MAPVTDRRLNGAGCPPHPLQATSWVMFVALVSAFYVLFNHFLDVEMRVVAGVLFGIFAVSAFVAAAYSTIVDPTDQNAYIARDAFDGRSVPVGLLFCKRCDRHVQETSKHCIVCNKCVDGYDHHCVWLNNCVGLHNYIAFITSLVCTSSMLAVMSGVGIFIFVSYVGDQQAFEVRVHALYPDLPGTAFIGITAAIWIVQALLLGLILQLLAFHSYLIDHNITTYDFVMVRSRVDYDSPEAEPTECQKDCERSSRACDPSNSEKPCKPESRDICCKPVPPSAAARAQPYTAREACLAHTPACCRQGADCRDGQCDGAAAPEYTGKGSVISMWRSRKAAGNLDGLAHMRHELAGVGVELASTARAGAQRREREGSGRPPRPTSVAKGKHISISKTPDRSSDGGSPVTATASGGAFPMGGPMGGTAVHGTSKAAEGSTVTAATVLGVPKGSAAVPGGATLTGTPLVVVQDWVHRKSVTMPAPLLQAVPAKDVGTEVQAGVHGASTGSRRASSSNSSSQEGEGEATGWSSLYRRHSRDSASAAGAISDAAAIALDISMRGRTETEADAVGASHAAGGLEHWEEERESVVSNGEEDAHDEEEEEEDVLRSGSFRAREAPQASSPSHIARDDLEGQLAVLEDEDDDSSNEGEHSRAVHDSEL